MPSKSTRKVKLTPEMRAEVKRTLQTVSDAFSVEEMYRALVQLARVVLQLSRVKE